ncbi:MAG: toxin [Acidimicrobiales bacterium]
MRWSFNMDPMAVQGRRRSLADYHPANSFVIRFPRVEFAPSARRHQAEDRFEDADILHAIEHALYVGDDGDDPDKALYLVPDRAARLLEVVVAVRSDGSEVVIHAMKMQPRYQALLGHLGSSDG